MAVRGTKPKDDGKKRFRGGLTHEWTEVPDRVFRSAAPVKLPAKRELSTPRGSVSVDLCPMTKQWWDTVRKMPHCVLWTAADWQFALTTALVADLSFRGVASAAAELRQRESILGTTLDARRDLRIRYIDPAEKKSEPATTSAKKQPPGVSSLDERRSRISAS